MITAINFEAIAVPCYFGKLRKRMGTKRLVNILNSINEQLQNKLYDLIIKDYAADKDARFQGG